MTTKSKHRKSETKAKELAEAIRKTEAKAKELAEAILEESKTVSLREKRELWYRLQRQIGKDIDAVPQHRTGATVPGALRRPGSRLAGIRPGRNNPKQ